MHRNRAFGIRRMGECASLAVEADHDTEITIDLEAREVRGGGVRARFEIDDYTRWRLMEGLDDIGLTLRHSDKIADFERRRSSWLPVTA